MDFGEQLPYVFRVTFWTLYGLVLIVFSEGLLQGELVRALVANVFIVSHCRALLLSNERQIQ